MSIKAYKNGSLTILAHNPLQIPAISYTNIVDEQNTFKNYLHTPNLRLYLFYIFKHLILNFRTHKNNGTAEYQSFFVKQIINSL